MYAFLPEAHPPLPGMKPLVLYFHPEIAQRQTKGVVSTDFEGEAAE